MKDRFRHDGALADALLLLEHPPVYTLGRGATEANVKFDYEPSRPETCKYEVHRVERGGEVTYHGPGQVVVYPVFDLRLAPHRQDLRYFLRQIEEVVIRVLGEYGIEGERDEEYTGVWADGRTKKLCAIGINASRWVTIHGLALNVTPEALPGFDHIVPCGIDESTRGVGCIQDYVPEVTVEDVRRKLLDHFASVFSLDVEETAEDPFA
jgi:lipoyl(octanoyl) transferase